MRRTLAAMLAAALTLTACGTLTRQPRTICSLTEAPCTRP